jgi:hypothetical protein
MPKTKPLTSRVPQNRKAVLLSISVPRDVADLFYDEAGGDGYGVRSALFRKMLFAWVANKTDPETRIAALQTQLAQARSRAQAAEAKLARIREAGGWRE